MLRRPAVEGELKLGNISTTLLHVKPRREASSCYVRASPEASGRARGRGGGLWWLNGGCCPSVGTKASIKPRMSKMRCLTKFSFSGQSCSQSVRLKKRRVGEVCGYPEEGFHSWQWAYLQQAPHFVLVRHHHSGLKQDICPEESAKSLEPATKSFVVM
jgi:hypothetical protein